VYNRTTYFDHVDVRVNGFFTTGTDGNTTTNKITLKNVALLVTDGNKTLIDTIFKDENKPMNGVLRVFKFQKLRKFH